MTKENMPTEFKFEMNVLKKENTFKGVTDKQLSFNVPVSQKVSNKFSYKIRILISNQLV